MMKPTFVVLDIYKGTTFNEWLQFLNPDGSEQDLSGFVVRMQIRESIEKAAVILELGTADDTILVDSLGNFKFDVPDSVTSALPSPIDDVAEWQYDVEWVTGTGAVERPIEGVVLVWPEVTR